MSNREQIANAAYVSFATFKRSGDRVHTPVWAAPLGDYLYVFSAADAGKVKRLRNSDQAQITTCDMRGDSLGTWHDAKAYLVVNSSEVTDALKALRDKYGWQMVMADLGSKLTGRFNKRAYIRIELAD